MDNYKNRVVDNLLERKLKGKGAVLIQGAKWCGKTTTAEQKAKSILYMDDPQNEYITSNRPLYHSQMSHQERAVNLT